MITCEWCGEAFERSGKKGPVPRYCRPSHRQRAFEDRHGGEQSIAELKAEINVLRAEVAQLRTHLRGAAS